MQAVVQQWPLATNFSVLKTMDCHGNVSTYYHVVPFGVGTQGVSLGFKDSDTQGLIQGRVEFLHGVPYIRLDPNGLHGTCSVLSEVDPQGNASAVTHMFIRPTPNHMLIPLIRAHGGGEFTHVYIRHPSQDAPLQMSDTEHSYLAVHCSRIISIEVIYYEPDPPGRGQRVAQGHLKPAMRSTTDPSEYYSTDFMLVTPAASGASSIPHRASAAVIVKAEKPDSDDDVVEVTEEQRLINVVRQVIAEDRRPQNVVSHYPPRSDKVVRSPNHSTMVRYNPYNKYNGALARQDDMQRMIQTGVDTAIQSSPLFRDLTTGLARVESTADAARNEARRALQVSNENKDLMKQLGLDVRQGNAETRAQLDAMIAGNAVRAKDAEGRMTTTENTILSLANSQEQLTRLISLLSNQVTARDAKPPPS